MSDLFEDGDFFGGLLFGISLHQQLVIKACKEKTHLKIDGELFYIQSGRERLKEMIEKICE